MLIKKKAVRVTAFNQENKLAKANLILKERSEIMMPLIMANTGEENMIRKVGGSPETRKFLKSLGFVAGGTVTVVSEISGNVIVNVKESRVAVSKEMAQKIMI